MSPVIDYGHCELCHASLTRNGECLNPNCENAQHAATRDAARDTAKATAQVSRPNAFSSVGRVD